MWISSCTWFECLDSNVDTLDWFNFHVDNLLLRNPLKVTLWISTEVPLLEYSMWVSFGCIVDILLDTSNLKNLLELN